MWLLEEIYSKDETTIGYFLIIRNDSDNNLNHQLKEERILTNVLYDHTFNINKSLIKKNVPLFFGLSSESLTNSTMLKKLSMIANVFNIVIELKEEQSLSHELLIKIEFLQRVGVEICINDSFNRLLCDEGEMIKMFDYVKLDSALDYGKSKRNQLEGYQRHGCKIILCNVHDRSQTATQYYWAKHGSVYAPTVRFCEQKQQSVLLLDDSYERQALGNLNQWLERR
jgi:c-di-GMP-related signal transduction protein